MYMNKKVMVVDDDPSILIAVRELFESNGYDVYTVGSGYDCIDELKKGFKGVILMDIMMPRMDGWETIKKIVDDGLYQDVVIAMLTAKDMPDVKMNEFNDFVVDYINKPFDPDELISTVDYYSSSL
jgi:CheY-like chemotaxis protein